MSHISEKHLGGKVERRDLESKSHEPIKGMQGNSANRIAVRLRIPDRESSSISRFSHHVLYPLVESAERVGNERNLFSQQVFQINLRIRYFENSFIAIDVGKVNVGVAMGSELDKAFPLHFPYVLPAKALDSSLLGSFALPVAVNIFNCQEYRCRKTIPFENGIGIEEMILVPIVKGNSECFVIQCAPIDDMVDHLIKGDDSVPVLIKILHVRGEGFNGCIYTRGQYFPVISDGMVC